MLVAWRCCVCLQRIDDASTQQTQAVQRHADQSRRHVKEELGDRRHGSRTWVVAEQRVFLINNERGICCAGLAA